MAREVIYKEVKLTGKALAYMKKRRKRVDAMMKRLGPAIQKMDEELVRRFGPIQASPRLARALRKPHGLSPPVDRMMMFAYRDVPEVKKRPRRGK